LNLKCIKLQGKGTDKNEKAGLTLVDLAYRRAKAVKATKRALDSGKIIKKPQKKSNKSNPSRKTSSSRTEEMRELFQTDMKDKKPKQRGSGVGKKAQKSFKSKSRYQIKKTSHFQNYYLILLSIDRNICVSNFHFLGVQNFYECFYFRVLQLHALVYFPLPLNRKQNISVNKFVTFHFLFWCCGVLFSFTIERYIQW